MIETQDGLMQDVRGRFAHVDACPFTGERVFFENAGGALTLKSVVDTSAKFAAIPDNQGRNNAASHALVQIIETAKADMRAFFGTETGDFFVGESGTELLFRVISAAALGSAAGGQILGSTLEHPATRSAAARWAELAGKPQVLVAHDPARGGVGVAEYAPHLTAETRVATIVHTSPVTGIGVDVAAVAAAIRAVAPECFIIVDGIQHAAHGGLAIESYGIDAYIVSPYKMFSRHGYGVAWLSDRLRALPHDALVGGPAQNWELGTRDTGAYATFSDVVAYYRWLGGQFTAETADRARMKAASTAILAQEKALTDAMLFGTGNHRGLADTPGVGIVGGAENAAREGLVSFWVEDQGSGDLVEALGEAGIRVHIRKADHYSGNILNPMGLTDCIRVSVCHYNTLEEVGRFLSALRRILDR